MIKNFFKLFIKANKRTDHVLVGISLVCSFVSFLLILGINNASFVRKRVLLVQIIATIIGVCAALVISFLDYHLIAKLWKLFMPASVFLVMLTYVIGQKRASYIDDKAWLKIPFINLNFQPSEILKLAFIITFALHLEKVKDSINAPKTLLGLCLHGGFVTLLIVLQGDHGTAMVFVAIFAIMLFSAGLRWMYMATAGGLALALSPLFWFFILDNDKRGRIMAVINPSLDPTGKAWQQGNGLISIGSGQAFGKGLFSSEVSYIPEMHNDFIFAYAGEAMGFVGCVGIMIILGVLCMKILQNSQNATDLLGKYICIGVFALIFFQSFWGIGMCLSLLPVVGLPIPLFSAGGTSVVMNYVALGLVLNVHRYSSNSLFSEN